MKQAIPERRILACCGRSTDAGNENLTASPADRGRSRSTDLREGADALPFHFTSIVLRLLGFGKGREVNWSFCKSG